MRLLPASLAVRVGGVAAATAIAIAGGTTAASAATAAPAVGRVVTALSIGVTKPVVRPNQITAVVAGRLYEPREFGHGVRGKEVWLLRRGAGGHWLVAGHELTGIHGGVAFRVHVLVGAGYRLAFRGTANFAPSISAIRTVP